MSEIQGKEAQLLIAGRKGNLVQVWLFPSLLPLVMLCWHVPFLGTGEKEPEGLKWDRLKGFIL